MVMKLSNDYMIHLTEIDIVVLTFDVDDDPFGDWGWNRIGGDAEVGSHLRATDALQAQRVALIHRHWNKTPVRNRNVMEQKVTKLYVMEMINFM